MNKIKFVTLLFVFTLLAALPSFGASVILAWDPNTETDLAGYNVYVGTASRQYSQVLGPVPVSPAPTYTVNDLTPGLTYYFAVTAFNTSGLESDFSNEVSWTVPKKPNPPGNLRFTKLQIDSSSPTGTITVLTADNVNGPWTPLTTVQVNPTASPAAFFKTSQ